MPGCTVQNNFFFEIATFCTYLAKLWAILPKISKVCAFSSDTNKNQNGEWVLCDQCFAIVSSSKEEQSVNLLR